jgi:hypothetical protein
MNINTAFPSKYLKAADLGDARPVVTISHVDMEQMPGDAKEMRPVVFFEGKQKGVVLNRTNSKAIEAIAGSAETDDWAGVQVQLYVAIVSFKGEEVEAIRIKAPQAASKPKPVAPPVAIAAEDEIPF